LRWYVRAKEQGCVNIDGDDDDVAKDQEGCVDVDRTIERSLHRSLHHFFSVCEPFCSFDLVGAGRKST
jgi:hypothetical protein